ncbi:MAG: MBL fold metallo-hydrolase [Candidatus Coatesbacteria bacterium]
MKKLLTILAVVVAVPLVAIVVLFFSVLHAFTATTPIENEFEPAPGVHTVQLRRFSACFVVQSRPGKVVLVDAGMDPDAKAILRALYFLGMGSDAVEAVLLTHGHAANLGGLQVFSWAPVSSLEADVPLVEGMVGTPSPFGRLMEVRPTGVKVARVLRDGETVRFGSLAVRVFAVPGHTRGSAAYLARGVLFMGDSADSLKKGGMRGAKWWFSESLDANRRSLKALAARLNPADVKAIVFAHSGALAGLKALEDFAAAH